MPTDAQRIERIKYLVDNGFSDKIVVGHDTHTKHTLVSAQDKNLVFIMADDQKSSKITPYSLCFTVISLQVKYGGHGYGHFLEHVAPKMIDRGIPPETVHKFTVENPQKWLTFI